MITSMSTQLLGLALLLGQPANDPTPVIDAELAKRWQEEKLTPAEKASDQEFLRRASLDLIGRIPTLQEAGLSVRQAMWLMNSNVIQRELVSPQGPVAKAVKKYGASPEGLKKALPDFFAITLNRAPTAQEMERLTDPKSWQFRAGREQANAPAFWTSYYEDIFWALLNSSEFALNH
jgi:hypothetical protein